MLIWGYAQGVRQQTGEKALMTIVIGGSVAWGRMLSPPLLDRDSRGEVAVRGVSAGNAHRQALGEPASMGLHGVTAVWPNPS